MISDILKHTLIIGCGSFAGGALRYLIGLAMKGIGLVALGYVLTK